MKCEKKEGCFVWTYRKSDKKCHLKNEGAKSRKNKLSGHISGLKTCSGKCCDSACTKMESINQGKIFMANSAPLGLGKKYC